MTSFFGKIVLLVCGMVALSNARRPLIKREEEWTQENHRMPGSYLPCTEQEFNKIFFGMTLYNSCSKHKMAHIHLPVTTIKKMIVPWKGKRNSARKLVSFEQIALNRNFLC